MQERLNPPPSTVSREQTLHTARLPPHIDSGSPRSAPGPLNPESRAGTCCSRAVLPGNASRVSATSDASIVAVGTTSLTSCGVQNCFPPGQAVRFDFAEHSPSMWAAWSVTLQFGFTRD